MRCTFARAIAAGALLMALAPPGRAATIFTDDFETPGSNPGNGGVGRESYQDTTVTPTSFIQGWKITGPNDIFVHITPDIGNAIGSNFNSAHSGHRYVDLSGDTGGPHPTLFRDFATTVGAAYQVSFWVGGALPTDSALSTINVLVTPTDAPLTILAANAYKPDSPDGNGIHWRLVTLNFVAATTSTQLKFRDSSGTNDEISFIDDVSVSTVSAVPEPGSMTLLGLGAVGTLGYRFKRRKAGAGPAAAA